MNTTFLYQINVTRDCNLRCSHCYIHSMVKKMSGFMTVDNFIKIAESIGDHMAAIEYEHAEIHVIGGEPTMLGQHFFDEALPKAKEILDGFGFSYEFILVSNLLTRELLPIAGHFSRINTSYEPETRFPKQKLEDMWRANVRTLQDMGLDVSVTTAMTKPVLEIGAREILDRFYEEQGFKQMHFGFFIPAGDGRENKDSVFPEFVETSDFLIKSAEWYFEKRDTDPLLYVNPAESFLSAISRGEPLDDIVCPIIPGSMDIDYNGNAMTCLQGGGELDANWLGNVLETSVQQVAQSRDFRREVMAAARPHSSCLNCEEYMVCRSGCGVNAKFWDPETDDDCPGFKKFIKHMRHAYEVRNIKPKYGEYRGKIAF